jgi:hypothetical protein
MSKFDLQFMKSLWDSTGHHHLVCQSHLILEACDHREAVQAGQKEFCRQRGIDDWRLHADSVEIQPLDAAPQPPTSLKG